MCIFNFMIFPGTSQEIETMEQNLVQVDSERQVSSLFWKCNLWPAQCIKIQWMAYKTALQYLESAHRRYGNVWYTTVGYSPV